VITGEEEYDSEIQGMIQTTVIELTVYNIIH